MKNKFISLLSSTWNTFDIGKDSEPEEYRGRSPLAYYDAQSTLESSLANIWTIIVESPSRSETITNVLQATEQKKTWLLDLSQKAVEENPMNTIAPMSA